MIGRRLRLVATSTFVLSSLFAGSAIPVSAHAQYGGSTPAANATVSAAPSTLQITFTQELSDIQISVTGPDGSSATTGPAKFDLAQRHNASVPTRAAGPGLYIVVWHNVSGEDGDSNDGSFVFTVAGSGQPSGTVQPSGTAPSSAPAANAPAQPSAAAPSCNDNGVRTPGINDVRVDTFCKREAIRQKFAGQIDVASFNDDLASGKGLESALADAMADFQKEQAAKQKH